MSNGNVPELETGQSARFFFSWMQAPLSIGAVAPSGRSLARLMVSEVVAGSRVMELGAGTGTVTRAILERGVAERDLVLVERNAAFARLLERRFPRATVMQLDATELGEAAAELRGSMDFIISGLPTLLFPRSKQRRMVEQALEMLRPSGSLHQFTYGLRCPIAPALLAELGLHASLLGSVPLNLPPARVYRIRRCG